MKLLDIKYRFHQLMNSPMENRACKVSSCDFYNIFKVDVHVHGNSAMSADHLLDFIKRKATSDGKKKVLVNEDGTEATLDDMMNSLNIDKENLTLDTLDVRAADTFKRYDRFAGKYSPFGK
jgi:AMP deaminase